MALIDYTLEGKINKVNIAIDPIKSFEPLSHGLYDTPYYVAYSGGKDSDVIRILFDLAGVKYDLVHNHTTVDAPETVRYIRSIPNITINYPDTNMWKLIVKKLIPPTRVSRYCCAELKERGGMGRFVVTGVRWSESNRRKKNRGSVEILPSQLKNKIILNADNTESRKMLETCQLKGKRVLNPIVDWEDEDVWEFLSYYNCKSNPLYECGFSRIGCVGCPLSGSEIMTNEFERYPVYKDNYIRAFDKMVQARLELDKETSWKNGNDVFEFFMNDKKTIHDENQILMAGWDI